LFVLADGALSNDANVSPRMELSELPFFLQPDVENTSTRKASQIQPEQGNVIDPSNSQNKSVPREANSKSTCISEVEPQEIEAEVANNRQDNPGSNPRGTEPTINQDDDTDDCKYILLFTWLYLKICK